MLKKTTLYDCCCLYLKYTFTSRCLFRTPKQVSVTCELIRQMTPIDETKEQEYTMIFSNTLNYVRRIKSGTENLNVSLSYASIFSRWYMNSISEFPKTKVGSQCILRMADSFSHWCECFLSQSQYAGIVAKVLCNEYFTRFC